MGARELLADLAERGLSITAEGGDKLVIRPASKLTDNMRAVLRAAKPELLVLLNTPGSDIPAAFLDLRARLLRWGWPEAEAEKLAERLVKRDRDRDDDRVSCAECRHFRPGRCGNHKAAELGDAGIGRDLVALLQRCPGYSRVLPQQPLQG